VYVDSREIETRYQFTDHCRSVREPAAQVAVSRDSMRLPASAVLTSPLRIGGIQAPCPFQQLFAESSALHYVRRLVLLT